MSSKESKSVKKEVTAIVIGAGNRGSNYAEYGSSGPHPFKVSMTNTDTARDVMVVII